MNGADGAFRLGSSFNDGHCFSFPSAFCGSSIGTMMARESSLRKIE
jgi:hypothetical protein